MGTTEDILYKGVCHAVTAVSAVTIAVTITRRLLRLSNSTLLSRAWDLRIWGTVAVLYGRPLGPILWLTLALPMGRARATASLGPRGLQSTERHIGYPKRRSDPPFALCVTVGALWR